MYVVFDIMFEYGCLGIFIWKYSECVIVVDFFRDYEVICDDFFFYEWVFKNYVDKCLKKFECKWGMYMDDV